MNKFSINEIKEKIKYYLKNPIKLKEDADSTCRKIYGNKVFIRGLIEFSNICQMDCLYCGIRKSNINVNRYKLEKDEILDVVKKGIERGIKTFVLQSGEINNDQKFLIEIVSKIRKLSDDLSYNIAITLSCGIKTKKQYKELKEAGSDRYLLRFETANPELHKYLRNGISLKRRLKALEDLKELDFEVGSGFMTGLPGETEEDFIENIILSYKYQFDMIGIGPFIPHPDTPLAGSTNPSLEKALYATGLIRIFLPKANIPATTASGTLDNYGREKMLEYGANVLMPNITPINHKKDYLLYPGKICIDESGFECISCLSGRVKSVNKELSFDRGDSKNIER